MNNFKNLKVWQKSVDLVVDLYKLTDKFPDKEKFGLVSQINRSGVSIASNIAEGAGRNSPKEFNNFLGITLGSSCELETQLIISERIGFISKDELDTFSQSIDEIQKMSRGLKESLFVK